MSSEPTFSTGDLRSTAQDYKRDATRKHKWALGATPGVGRADGKPRPQRPSETHYNVARRLRGAATASFNNTNKARADIIDSSESNSDDGFSMPSPATEPTPVYSFDAIRSPSHGSQILNAALAKAVEKFEERETAKLVKDEYDVLNNEGESVDATPKKSKSKKKNESAVLVADDDDYEFV